MGQFDKWTELMTRKMASKSSRRGFFTKVAGAALGGAVLPTLPIARASAQVAAEDNGVDPIITGLENDPGDTTSCDYWRYCGIDGQLCSCCGGSHTTCPPGTEMSQIAWVGTCRNPADNRNYIISYNDCCGGPSCERCFCNRNESDTPVTRPQSNNDIIWCFGTDSESYTCTVGLVLGVALEDE
ncbi:MAG: methylamine dehydrogenase (amicyanin) light chain [Kordiimonadaceae bacterium]|jgi:methylamine dehydrogenase light chain|nr:methylamine dehydrogenase (amicyanin) light chain [Kordiimonadaceae bacterium]MBT6035063.1 methylamine dehydrogenase (amicyanin) light chain [Kordiimonadaceae bacterium]MBT6330343.1 methylamine dehydrogenase (amicyanin) light chain [Kordiimonadaceae bacterium]